MCDKFYNTRNIQPVELLRWNELIVERLGKKAVKNFMATQLGDIPAAYADFYDLINAVGLNLNTPIETGIGKFIKWYKNNVCEVHLPFIG